MSFNLKISEPLGNSREIDGELLYYVYFTIHSISLKIILSTYSKVYHQQKFRKKIQTFLQASIQNG